MTPPETASTPPAKPQNTGRKVALGLVAGVVCGILFGEYCQALDVVGWAYVGLLQMTVLPYLAVSLVSKLGRLDLSKAGQLGLRGLVALLCFWAVGVLLVTAVSAVLPPIEGASFFHGEAIPTTSEDKDALSMFIPTNIFYSLSHNMVPAVVVFCLFCGIALISIPTKEPLLNLLDTCAQVISRINLFLVRWAPLGLFALTASAAGTFRVEDLSRLQAYLVLYGLVSAVCIFGVFPLLICSVTTLRYRDILGAAQEPLYMAIATGKLFVTLPQIVEKCEWLIQQQNRETTPADEATPNVLVPLAYPFPHVGKILSFVFISFSAWYVGQDLTTSQTLLMASTGAVSSFASPLITMPYLLDEFHLPQDLMAFFILPGFITMRLGDMVGVMHLIALTLVVHQAMQSRLRIRWRYLSASLGGLLACSLLVGLGARWYLTSTVLEYNLDKQFLSLEIPRPHDDVVVFDDTQSREPASGLPESTLERIRTTNVLRVGYPANHVPYCYRNGDGELVGFDVELMHLLASRLDVRLEFVPFDKSRLYDDLDAQQFDLAIGGVLKTPERMLHISFSDSYEEATIAVALKDYRRREGAQWADLNRLPNFRLAVISEDLAAAAKHEFPSANVSVIDSYEAFFESQQDEFDGLLISAEEGAVWNVLHPDFTTVIPTPVLKRPVGFAVRLNDSEWNDFLDNWIEFERLDGSFDRLRKYWIEGDGTHIRQPRWCVLQDILQWYREEPTMP